ncbi:phosphotransferase [Nonomuraea thailandensis]
MHGDFHPRHVLSAGSGIEGIIDWADCGAVSPMAGPGRPTRRSTWRTTGCSACCWRSCGSTSAVGAGCANAVPESHQHSPQPCAPELPLRQERVSDLPSAWTAACWR